MPAITGNFIKHPLSISNTFVWPNKQKYINKRRWGGGGGCGRLEKGLGEVTQADHWDGRLVMLRKDSGVSFRAVRTSQAPEEKDAVVWLCYPLLSAFPMCEWIEALF